MKLRRQRPLHVAAGARWLVRRSQSQESGAGVGVDDGPLNLLAIFQKDVFSKVQPGQLCMGSGGGEGPAAHATGGKLHCREGGSSSAHGRLQGAVCVELQETGRLVV